MGWPFQVALHIRSVALITTGGGTLVVEVGSEREMIGNFREEAMMCQRRKDGPSSSCVHQIISLIFWPGSPLDLCQLYVTGIDPKRHIGHQRSYANIFPYFLQASWPTPPLISIVCAFVMYLHATAWWWIGLGSNTLCRKSFKTVWAFHS